MTWDVSLPVGTEALSNGDNRIREFKTDMQTALRGNASDGTEAKFPGSDTANPIYRYRGLRGTTAARPSAGEYGLYINTTLNSIQRDNGTTWDDVATLIPSGTIMVFYQSSAPTGWTQNTSHNDKALRVVSGTGGGNGGAVGFTSAFAQAAHSHVLLDAGESTFAETPTSSVYYQTSGGTTYGVAGRLMSGDSTGGDITVQTVTRVTSDSGSISFVPLYIDVIIAAKD